MGNWSGVISERGDAGFRDVGVKPESPAAFGVATCQ